MENREIALYSIDNILKNGGDKAQCVLSNNKKYELNFGEMGISLLRTTIESKLSLVAIKDNKKSSISLNKLDKELIDEKVAELMEMCNSAEADECNDIAELQEKENFKSGDEEPDLEKMYELTKTFLKKIKSDFPEIKFMDGTTVQFNYSESIFTNSNGVEFKINSGIYDVSVIFLAKKGDKSSSFTYFGYSFEKLPQDLMEYGDVRQRLKDVIMQVDCKGTGDKFVGDVILTPELVTEMLYYYDDTFIGDRALITGTSILKDKLNEKVASEKLTVKCMPVCDKIANKSFVTSDGFKTENVTLFENGVLKSFMIGLYAAKKTSKPVTKTDLIFVVNNGDTELEKLIKSTKRGIILGRFSGGRPSSNGDFAGVAKNSFYVENGEIKYAITETMISANLYDMFNSIEAISKETLNSGSYIAPWMKINGITISGK